MSTYHKIVTFWLSMSSKANQQSVYDSDFALDKAALYMVRSYLNNEL